MLSEAVVVAIITGVFSVVGQMIIARKHRREAEIKEALRDQKTDMRLDSIEHKIDIHNGYAEKFGEIEKNITEINTKIHLWHPN